MTDIFSETTATPTLDDFVGEGKKYSDNSAVAKALVEKDAFINRLLEEKRRMEEDFRARENTKAFDDRIKALEQAKLAEQVETPLREATPPLAPAPTLDPEKVEEMVQQTIAKREAANARTKNLLVVQDKLTEVFGENYTQHVKTRAAELGMTLPQLNEMAANSPQAFFALVGANDVRQPDHVAPPASRVNPAAFSTQPNARGNKYYSEMRKTNPTKYYTPAVQLEEFNELKRQGPEKFYST